MGYSFSGEHISLFSKRAVRFFLFLLAKVHKSVGFGKHNVDFCTFSNATPVQIYNSFSAEANRFMNFRQ